MAKLKLNLLTKPGFITIVVFLVIVAIAIILGQLAEPPEKQSKSASIVKHQEQKEEEKKTQDKPDKQKTQKSSETQAPETAKADSSNKKEQSSPPAEDPKKQIAELAKQVAEIKQDHEVKIAEYEETIKEQNKENTRLKTIIEQAKKEIKKPDLKETTPAEEIIEIISQEVSDAKQKFDESREKRRDEESNWANYFKQFSSGAPQQEPPQKDTLKNPVKSLKKLFNEEQAAAKTAVQVAQKAENRLSPGRGKTKEPFDFENLKQQQPSQETYERAFRGLMSIGKEKIDKPSVQWAILNDRGQGLRQVYPLFNMQPLARHNNRYYDLTDFETVTKYKLDAYAPTGILCEHPNRDFGDRLQLLEQHSGIKPSDVTVIYFMNDNILNYFHNKVQRAVRCAVSNGLVTNEQIKKSKVRVTGNVLAVNSPTGKHRFGIYVPRILEIYDIELKSIKEVSLEVGVCFGKDPDLAPLMADGMIN